MGRSLLINPHHPPLSPPPQRSLTDLPSHPSPVSSTFCLLSDAISSLSPSPSPYPLLNLSNASQSILSNLSNGFPCSPTDKRSHVSLIILEPILPCLIIINLLDETCCAALSSSPSINQLHAEICLQERGVHWDGWEGVHQDGFQGVYENREYCQDFRQ